MMHDERTDTSATATPAEPAEPAEPAAPSRADATHADRSWVKLLVGAIFVLVVAGGFSYLMSEDPAERGETIPIGAFTLGATDDFNRPDSVGDLGTGPLGTWTTEGGLWTLQIGVALASFPDPEFNAALVDATVRDVSVSANVGGQGVCGIAVRYADPRNYLALLRVNDFAVWNVVEVVDGVERIIGKVDDVPGANVTVTLEVGPDVVTARVGMGRFTAVASPAQGGTRVGFVARGGDMSSCVWDDVTVRTATS